MKQTILALLALLSLGCAWAADVPKGATAAPTALTGQVLEVKDVESYTYLRLKTRDGETWAAVATAPVKTGSEVTIENAMVMRNFESKTLNRKFDQIWFGTIAGSAPATGATAAGGAMGGAGAMAGGGDMGAMHAGMVKPVGAGSIKVAKAAGADARTVAEIVAGRVALKDRKVVVRGKVVKYTPEVMGKNWVHLRDGSGSAADGTDDVLITTMDVAKIGDVVLVKGMVRTDRDLGSGYSYKVLVEDATLQK